MLLQLSSPASSSETHAPERMLMSLLPVPGSRSGVCVLAQTKCSASLCSLATLRWMSLPLV